MPTCPSCGRVVPEGTVFCPFDGTNLKQATSQASPTGGYGATYSPPPSRGMYSDGDLAKITNKLSRLTYVVAFEAVILAALILIILFG